GKVNITKTVRETEKILATLGAGEFFGEMSILNHKPRSAGAVVAEDAKLLVIDPKTFEAMIRGNVEIAVRLIKKLSDRLQEADEQIENLLFRDPSSRVVHYLWQAALKRGKDTPQGRLLSVNLNELHVRMGVNAPEDIVRMEDIFLTHSHFDHVKDVPLMTDLLVGKREKPVIVHGPAETMEAMDKDVFNNRVWPDFRTIPTREKPVIAFDTIPVYEPVACQGLRIRAVPVHHPVYSVGYIIEGRNGAIAFSGDTGPTEELWKAINATPNVKAVFVELSFPSSMQWLADASGHLTPRTMMGELSKLDRRGATIYLYHLKPAVIDEVKAEIRALRKDFLHVCELDEVYGIQ